MGLFCEVFRSSYHALSNKRAYYFVLVCSDLGRSLAREVCAALERDEKIEREKMSNASRGGSTGSAKVPAQYPQQMLIFLVLELGDSSNAPRGAQLKRSTLGLSPGMGIEFQSS